MNDSLAKADTLIEVIKSRKTTDILNYGERDECREIVSQIASLVAQSKNNEVEILFKNLKFLMKISDEITPNEYQSHISKLLEVAKDLKLGLKNILKKLEGEGELSTPDFNGTSQEELDKITAQGKEKTTNPNPFSSSNQPFGTF